jgi:hypothetical protein
MRGFRANRPIYANPETTAAYSVVAQWGGNVGANTLFDYGPTKKWHGALQNSPKWTSGGNGSPALSFVNASTQYVYSAQVLSFPYTMLCRVNVTTFANTPVPMAFAAPSTADIAEFYLSSNTAGIYVQQAGNDPGTVNITGGTVATATDCHVAGIFSASLKQLFVNGASVASSTNNANPANIDRFYLGANRYAGTDSGYFDGKIWDAVICNKAMSEAQIKDLADNPFLLWWQPSPVKTFWMSPPSTTGNRRRRLLMRQA